MSPARRSHRIASLACWLLIPTCAAPHRCVNRQSCNHLELGGNSPCCLQVRQWLLVGFVLLLPFIGIVCLPALFIMHMTPVRRPAGSAFTVYAVTAF